MGVYQPPSKFLRFHHPRKKEKRKQKAWVTLKIDVIELNFHVRYDESFDRANTNQRLEAASIQFLPGIKNRDLFEILLLQFLLNRFTRQSMGSIFQA